MDTQDIIRNSSKYLSAQDAVCFAYLFGSIAKGSATPLSDVDIAVYLFEGLDNADKRMEFAVGLSRAIKTDRIDLVVLNKAPVSLLSRVLPYKIILVDKDPFARHRFESLAMRKCMDFLYFENKILENRFLNG